MKDFSSHQSGLIAKIDFAGTDYIYKSEFRKVLHAVHNRVKQRLGKAGISLLLDRLIEEKLILKSAQLEQFCIAENEVYKKIAELKHQHELAEHEFLSMEEFKIIIMHSGLYETWEDYVKQVHDKLLIKSYVMHKIGIVNNYMMGSTDSEIDMFYKVQRKRFIQPEMVQVKQIFIPLTSVPKDDVEIYYERAREIFGQIKSGEPFDCYSDVYVKGKRESIGTVIFDLFTRNDSKKRKLLGRDFIDAVMSMEERKISGVLTSKRGLHLVAVIKRYPGRTLKKKRPYTAAIC